MTTCPRRPAHGSGAALAALGRPSCLKRDMARSPVSPRMAEIAMKVMCPWTRAPPAISPAWNATATSRAAAHNQEIEAALPGERGCIRVENLVLLVEERVFGVVAMNFGRSGNAIQNGLQVIYERRSAPVVGVGEVALEGCRDVGWGALAEYTGESRSSGPARGAASIRDAPLGLRNVGEAGGGQAEAVRAVAPSRCVVMASSAISRRAARRRFCSSGSRCTMRSSAS